MLPRRASGKRSHRYKFVDAPAQVWGPARAGGPRPLPGLRAGHGGGRRGTRFGARASTRVEGRIGEPLLPQVLAYDNLEVVEASAEDVLFDEVRGERVVRAVAVSRDGARDELATKCAVVTTGTSEAARKGPPTRV